MAILFLDSSALVKRYVAETGSAWVQELTDASAGHRIYVARITGVEIVAAIARRQRLETTTAAEAASMTAAFRADFTIAYYTLEINAPLIVRAMDLAERHGLRGYDAVQLAVALFLRDQCRLLGLPDPQVITADTELNAAAIAEGLSVENPNTHP